MERGGPPPFFYPAMGRSGGEDRKIRTGPKNRFGLKFCGLTAFWLFFAIFSLRVRKILRKTAKKNENRRRRVTVLGEVDDARGRTSVGFRLYMMGDGSLM